MKSIGCFISFVIATLSITGCSQETKVMTEQQVAIAWGNMTIYVTKNTPANSPTYASRALGYIGVTMYESIVCGYPEYKTLEGQLNGLTALPVVDKKLQYNWILSLNAGQASVLKYLYNQTSDANKLKIDSLEEVIFNQFSGELDQDVVSRSVSFGREIATAIFEWSKTDGGHRAYLHNFDKKIRAPETPGSWEPPLYGQSFSHYPLHPHWGENRTFIKADSESPMPQIISFDKSKQSSYYSQFIKVYEKNKSLTQQDKEAALWWGDDPSDTFTPPGHSYYLATQILKKSNPTLIKCAETYARIGIAVADAFINCWKWKYHFFSERPSSYITKSIDERWEAFWPDPPFPAFPSGHATQAAAVATVMIDLFGEKFTFTDSAHVSRKRDELRNVDFKPRTFTSFWQVAEETANSRFFGGIHTPQDNEVGLSEGSKVGRNVNGLNWHNNKK